MDIFSLRESLVEDYKSFTSSFVQPRDTRIAQFSYGTACQAPRIACVATDSGRDGPEARRPAEPSSRRGPPG